MSKPIVISVDMEIQEECESSAKLTRVVDSTGQDRTDLYKSFCKDNGFDITKRAEIEGAAVPFTKKYDSLLP